MVITVKTAKALDTVTKHYAAHKEEYEKQLDGWKKLMQEYTDELSDWAKTGGKQQRPTHPTKPAMFDKEYKRLVLMLDLHEHITIELHDHEFDQIFLDKFNWRGTFLSNSSLYTGQLAASDEDDDL